MTTEDDDALLRALKNDEDLPDLEEMRARVPDIPQPWQRIVRVIDRFADLCGHALSWLVLALVVIVVLEAIRRYAFNSPSIWGYDMSYMLYGTIFMLGAGTTLRFGGHIRTDLFFNTWSPRQQAAVDLGFYTLLFFPGMAFFLLAGFDKALSSYLISERASASFWRPILWPYRAVIPLTALLVMIQGVSEVIKAYFQFKTGETV
ncbi:transporter [Salipiger aestuarii]|uniref:TRAP transporter small permease protein n=1 Tax=Salipiger aestuarii TaxID=568098 RepID=A0A327XLV6_9RHOB|nr:TRAP transporter small permease subunit [Salipiger aestuarii]EIE50270.1 putative transporter DctQ-like transmembrane protein [Citreicella sp. 357]KAA8605029.1 transporter [Salipiger aestuarii]KAA8606429.1 transporter [Salipiger aestuarii]KAB2532426.1 transporter [Salipiger aestuarii]RAK09007.1 TRAP-type mannitol/chloroaromatic compound transport system permease small subunit [Salipiger aestuarii]